MSVSKIPQVGEKAPHFILPALPDGNPVRLSDFEGRPVVLFFYPGDLTPTCTTEACDFRDAHAALTKSGAAVLGVSPDGIASHRKFAAKYSLPFPLLADEAHAVAEKYGLWVEKTMFGRKYWGVQRATFLIDGKGTVAAAWPRVAKIKGHVSAVGEELAKLGRK